MLLRIFWIATIFVIAGCGFLKEPGTPLAKVKDQTLTLEELSSRGAETRDSVMGRVREWVDQQVLVQEALAMGVQNDPEVQWLLRDAERKIILDAFNRSFENKIADPEEGELEIYFEKHRDRFVREEPAFLFHVKNFPNVLEAKAFVKAADSLAFQDSLQWRNAQVLSTCHRGILATLRPGAISIPQLCGDSVVVLKLTGMKPVGDSLSYHDSRNQILSAVRREHRQRKLDSLLMEAKSRHAVFTWPENLPSK